MARILFAFLRVVSSAPVAAELCPNVLFKDLGYSEPGNKVGGTMARAVCDGRFSR